MNLYDTKSVICSSCKSVIGEIEYDVKVMLPLCGKCANPMPEGDDILYTASYFQNNTPLKKSMIVQTS